MAGNRAGAVRVILITLGLATAVTTLQLWLKLTSRTPLPGKKHGLTGDDFVWWIEWVVLASVALITLLIVSSAAKRPIAIPPIVLTTITLFLGYSALPWLVKTYAYNDKGHVKGWKQVVAMNAVGMLVLLAAVSTGAKIYG